MPRGVGAVRQPPTASLGRGCGQSPGWGCVLNHGRGVGSRLQARPCPAGGARAMARATWPPRVHTDPPLTSLGSLYVSLGWGQGAGLAASSRLCPEGQSGVGPGHGPARGH